MIHQPMGGVDGQASDIEITAREIQKLKKELYSIISEHSGKPLKNIEKDLVDYSSRTRGFEYDRNRGLHLVGVSGCLPE